MERYIVVRGIIMGNDRDKKIGRIKTFLLAGPYILVLVPIVICIVLLFIINNQNKRISILSDSISELEAANEENLSAIDELNKQDEHIDESVQAMAKNLDRVKSEVSKMRNPNQWPRKVYLTFDDGPSSNTEKILDILEEYGVKGNFFVVGTQNENLKKMYKKIVDGGHVIGMHSYSHKYSEIYVSRDAFTKDLDKIAGLVYDETGVFPTIYRFPGGSSNDVSKVPMADLIDILDKRNIKYYDWNVVSGDAVNPIPSTETIISNVLDNISKNEESMILFHDLANKTTTVEALPKIIEAILDQGITIAPIDDTTMLIQHNK